MPSDWSSDVCRSEEHTSELQSHDNLVCRLLLEKKKNTLFVVRTAKLHRVSWFLVISLSCRSCVWRVSPGCYRRCVSCLPVSPCVFFFFNDTAPTEFYALSLHEPFPI